MTPLMDVWPKINPEIKSNTRKGMCFFILLLVVEVIKIQVFFIFLQICSSGLYFGKEYFKSDISFVQMFYICFDEDRYY